MILPSSCPSREMNCATCEPKPPTVPSSTVIRNSWCLHSCLTSSMSSGLQNLASATVTWMPRYERRERAFRQFWTITPYPSKATSLPSARTLPFPIYPTVEARGKSQRQLENSKSKSSISTIITKVNKEHFMQFKYGTACWCQIWWPWNINRLTLLYKMIISNELCLAAERSPRLHGLARVSSPNYTIGGPLPVADWPRSYGRSRKEISLGWKLSPFWEVWINNLLLAYKYQ